MSTDLGIHIAEQTHFGNSYKFRCFEQDEWLKRETEALCNALLGRQENAVYAAFLGGGTACLCTVSPGRRNKRRNVVIDVYKVIGTAEHADSEQEAAQIYDHLLQYGGNEIYICGTDEAALSGALMAIAPYVPAQYTGIPVQIAFGKPAQAAPRLSPDEIPLFAAAVKALSDQMGFSNRCLHTALTFTGMLHRNTIEALLCHVDPDTIDQWSELFEHLMRERLASTEDVRKMMLLLYLYGKIRIDSNIDLGRCSTMLLEFEDTGRFYWDILQHPAPPICIDRLEKLFLYTPTVLRMDRNLCYFRDTTDPPENVQELMLRLFLKKLANVPDRDLRNELTGILKESPSLRVAFLRELGNETFRRRLEVMSFFGIDQFLQALNRPKEYLLPEHLRFYALWMYFYLIPIPCGRKHSTTVLTDHVLCLLCGNDKEAEEAIITELVALLKESHEQSEQEDRQTVHLLRKTSPLFRKATKVYRKSELEQCREELDEARRNLKALRLKWNYWRWLY